MNSLAKAYAIGRWISRIPYAVSPIAIDNLSAQGSTSSLDNTVIIMLHYM